MIYRAIGIISGGEPASLKICFTEFTVTAKQWQCRLIEATQINYDNQWQQLLATALTGSVTEFVTMHNQLGQYMGHQINEFINQYLLQHQVQLISCNGHALRDANGTLLFTLGNAAATAAVTGLPVISNLGDINEALGGSVNNLFTKAAQLLFAKNPEADSHIQMGNYKEAILVALSGVLRWREEATVLPAETGASRESIGGALWLGNEA